MRRTFLFILVVLFTIPTYSQQSKFKDRKNIYLLDVTLSMFGYNGAPDIFVSVRDELIKSIDAVQNPNTEIVVVTFQDRILETWTENATRDGKGRIIDSLKGIKEEDLDTTNTNIHCAWEKGRELVDSDKLNVIYLLTDGVHNMCSPSKDVLYNEVEYWGDFSNDKDAYAFLVELVDKARDDKLREIVNSTQKAQVISDMNFYVFSIKDNEPIVNLHEDLEFELDFIGDRIDEIPSDLEFTIKIDDENFTISENMFKLNEKPITVKLIPNGDIDDLRRIPQTEWYSRFTISFNEKRYPNVKILDNKINLKIKNQKEMVLSIKFLDE